MKKHKDFMFLLDFSFWLLTCSNNIPAYVSHYHCQRHSVPSAEVDPAKSVQDR